MTTRPRISVVIPTRARPDLVMRALASALEQTWRDLEVVVVIDGPDPTTEAALAAIGDPRVRIVVADPPRGGGGARNLGVEAARGDWIAFLDDDDVWLPTKLERQLAAIEASGVAEPIGFCQIVVRSSTGDRAWRSRHPESDEPVGDYLFARRSLRTGEGTVGTSTIVARRALLQAIPFDASVRRYQDADWILRAAAAGAALVECPERLSIWTAPDARGSITGDHGTDWPYAFEWIRERRRLVTPRAYAAFLLVRVAALAAAAGDRSAIAPLWREARRAGRPGVLDVVLFAGRWLVPDAMRTRLRQALVSVRDPMGRA